MSRYNYRTSSTSGTTEISPERQQELNATRTSYNPNNPYRYTFTGTLEGKDVARQQAIVDTICYLGWMSLKDSDHNGSGTNAAATKRIQREAVETRKAAETLLSNGTITIMGTWSNGIAVGPGPNFVHIDHSAETKRQLDVIEANQKRAHRVTAKSLPNGVKYFSVTENGKEIAHKATRPQAEALVKQITQAAAQPMEPTFREGDDCPMRYSEGACCPVTLKVNKPRVRITLAQMQAQPARLVNVEAQQRVTIKRELRKQGQPIPAYLNPSADDIADAAVAAITGEEYTAPAFVAPAYVAPTFVAPPMPVPTPIRPSAPYTPRVGDTVNLVYRHENGTTTNRTVDVQRVGKDLFRGYDRTYSRVRNFEYRHLASIALASGKEAVA